METPPIQIPPFSVEIDGYQVDILEVVKTQLVSGDKWYHVVVQVNYKGIKSRRYTLDVKNEQDLINKLKVELTKIRFIDYAYGTTELKRLIT
jgi:hypothetical protein